MAQLYFHFPNEGLPNLRSRKNDGRSDCYHRVGNYRKSIHNIQAFPATVEENEHQEHRYWANRIKAHHIIFINVFAQ
ncbi:MAG: hypothetical protein BM561_10260 [Vibrio sp. MedPE-SWchi]|nr:MAG: hypothetical protein BM561_10260 [Vibrio sp. MedPE-SWchi]